RRPIQHEVTLPDGKDPSFHVSSSIILQSLSLRHLWLKTRRGDLSSAIADNPVLTSLGAGRLSKVMREPHDLLARLQQALSLVSSAAVAGSLPKSRSSVSTT